MSRLKDQFLKDGINGYSSNNVFTANICDDNSIIGVIFSWHENR